MKTLFALFLSFFLLPFTCFSNDKGFEPYRHYKIRRVSPVGGLGIDGQRDVRQDKWGFIWVITDNLYRFDGYSFKHYAERLNRPDSSANWSFHRLEIDREGDLYVSSGFGLLKYNPLTDNFDYLYRGNVDLVKEDQEGRLWISNNSSVGIFNRNTLEFTPIESDNGATYSATALCVKGDKIFVGTLTGKIFLYDEGSNSFRQVFEYPQCNIVDITYTDSLLYILTESEGLKVISINGYQETGHYDFFYPGGDGRVSARALFIDKFGHLWITGQRGIYILNPETKEYVHYYYDKTDPYGLPSSSVWRISEDSQGNLWFGTYSGGLCFINLDEQRNMKTFNGQSDDLNYPLVSSFEEDENAIWIGTEGRGLNRYDKRTGEFTYFMHQPGKNSLSYDNIQALLFTGSHKLWIGMSRGGMDCFDTKTGTFTHYTLGNAMLKNDHVQRIVAEADSGLWIKYLMDRDYLTYLSFKDNKTKHYDFLSSPIQINGSLDDIKRGKGDTLWIVSSHKLVWMNVRTREVSFASYAYSDIENIQDVHIMTILPDNANAIVWLGTREHGLLSYDAGKQSLTQKADLSMYNVYAVNSMNKDPDGNIWMGTNNGLFRYDIETGKLQQFNKADGAQGDMYYTYSTFLSKTGELYFGGNEGFTIIDPVKNTHNDYKPSIIISEFLLDNNPVIPGIEDSPLKSSIFQTQEIELNYNQNNFSFEFTSTNYLNPDKNRFKYRLKGYDDRWVEADAVHRRASYAKVPAGRYAFDIMTANNDGVWGELTSLQVIVKPAPWFSPWAIVGYVLLSFILFYIALKYYAYQRRLKMQFYLEEQEKKRKEQYHQEQLKFFTNVSHDFRTPLSLILAALDSIKAGRSTSKYLSILENNAKRLLALINELMDFRSLQNNKVRLELLKGDWNAFVSGNCSDFSDYAGHKNILFETYLDESIPRDLYFDARMMEKIILNLLNNAFKYTSPQGKITVRTLGNVSGYKSQYANSIIINPGGGNTGHLFGMVICDSGVGISEMSIGLVFERYYRVNESSDDQHLGSGIGLALVKSLVELHKGYIAIYSERDKGSDIVIGFPVDASVYAEDDFSNEPATVYLSGTKIIHDQVVSEEEEQPVDGYVPLPVQYKKCVLVVEDNDDLRDMLVDMLRDYYEVKEAANGLEAMNLIDEEEADLILTDIMMPGMNGIELSKAIKGSIETSHIPVVILTAKTGPENQIEGLHSGADAYLEKPVNKQVLLLMLSNIFKQQVRIKEYYAKNYFVQAGTNDSPVNKREAEFMKQLIGLIEDNLSNTEIDVLQIASALAMSRRKLYGKVKAMTGQSVVEFIRNYRLRKAAQILVEEDLSISLAMERVGIDNASYFSRIFKKEFGESPSDFIVHHRQL